MKNYIIGLDSLRAIAALCVVVEHIEQLKSENTSLTNFRSLLPSGHTGVILFFVISGYIITTLLLKEKEVKKTISIKKFYLRRIFRIWPLYYFIIILSAFLFQFKPSAITLIYCLTILPNIAHITGSGWVVSPQIWSIGVEEQFYLAWPTFIKLKSKLLVSLIVIIISLILLPHVLLFILHKTHSNANISVLINRFFYGAKFDCMAMGSLMAYLTIHNPRFLDYFRKPPVSYICMITPFLLWLVNFETKYFADEIFGLLFSLLIVNVTYKNYLFFNHGILRYLGKISYGLYMYHWVVILFFFKIIFPYLPSMNLLSFNILLYSSMLLATIGISALSYHTFEMYFLRMKARYESE